ncbi:hypothetical protein DRP04_09780 [Archaeoglobales archaeon]|nr:MAG: hypothetical protein DRP04_09780 [Archaeoglobales archaeon]
MDAWSKAIFKILSGGTIIALRYLSDGSSGGSVSAVDSDYTSFSRVYIFGGHDYWVDQIIIRKCVEPEPKHGFWTAEETENKACLVVTDFDDTYSAGWDKVGASPYLESVDYPENYITSTSGDSSIGFFHFEDISANVINTVNLEVYLKNVMFGADIRVYVHDGTELHEVGDIKSYNAWSWQTLDVTNILNTPEKVNNAKVLLRQPGSYYNDTIDAMRMIVVYSVGPATLTLSTTLNVSFERNRKWGKYKDTLRIVDFDASFSEWNAFGQIPYLDLQDYPESYVSTTLGTKRSGYYYLENLPSDKLIKKSSLGIYCRSGEELAIFIIKDGSTFQFTLQPDSVNFDWYYQDVTSFLNSSEDINTAKIYFKLLNDYSDPEPVVDAINLKVDFKYGYSKETLEIQADSYVDEGNPDTNYGNQANLKVLRYSETLDCYAYLQATFPVIAIFASTVKFYWSGSDSSLALEPVEYFEEDEITWNNRPVAEGSSSIIVVTQGWNEISLDSFYSGQSRNRISLSFKLYKGDGGTISSRESFNKPSIIIEGYTVPIVTFVEKLETFNSIDTLNFYCQNRYSGRKLNICVCPTDRDVSYYSYWKHISLIYDTLNTSGIFQNVKVKAIQDKTIIIAGYKETDIGCPLDQYDEAKGIEYTGYPISSHSYYDSIVILDTFYNLDSRTFNLENPFTLKMLVAQCSFDHTHTTTKGAFETYPKSIYKYYYLGTIVFQGEYIPEDSTFDVTYELPYSLDYTCLTIPIEYVPHKTIQLALQFDTDISGGTIRAWDSVASSIAESQFLKGTEYSNYKSLLRACIVAENVDPDSLEGTLPSSWDTLSPQSEEFQLRGTIHELTFGSISAGKQVRLAFKLFAVEDLHLRNSPCKFELEILPSPSSILANISSVGVYWIPVEEIYFTGEYTGFRRHVWAKEIEFDYLQIPSSGYNSKASLWFKYPRSVDL